MLKYKGLYLNSKEFKHNSLSSFVFSHHKICPPQHWTQALHHAGTRLGYLKDN